MFSRNIFPTLWEEMLRSSGAYASSSTSARGSLAQEFQRSFPGQRWDHWPSRNFFRRIRQSGIRARRDSEQRWLFCGADIAQSACTAQRETPLRAKFGNGSDIVRQSRTKHRHGLPSGHKQQSRRGETREIATTKICRASDGHRDRVATHCLSHGS